MKAALIQLNVGDDPAVNLPGTLNCIHQAAGAGAELILTPEVSNCLSTSRKWQEQVLQTETQDQTLAAIRAAAAQLRVHISIGSLALKTDDPDGRFANRSFLIGPDGGVLARYDKIHMFDAQMSETETYRESAGYRPGSRAVVVETAVARLGLSICYDLRFPHLHRALAQAGAEILTVPSAFSPVSGAAHWQVLLQARAIETGCYVLAAAQTGDHPIKNGKPRRSYGHSMAVSPWGEVILDAGTEPGVFMVEIDREKVVDARRKIPSLTHDRTFEVAQ